MGSTITTLREARGISQAELARMVDVTPATINRAEKGTKRLSVPVAKQVARILECTLDDIFRE